MFSSGNSHDKMQVGGPLPLPISYTHLSAQLKDFKIIKFTQIMAKIISNGEKVGTKIRHGC